MRDGSYQPDSQSKAILDTAWAHVSAVPYQVSVRWVFYRLLQDGLLSGKADYKKAVALLSKARKRFYGQWTPESLADEGRQVDSAGYGYRDVDQWLRAIPRMVHSYVDRWQDQAEFVIVCFEAAAMAGQFDAYLPPSVPRIAFRGDISIPAKWKLAKLIEQATERYDRRCTVLYFGDYDPKGLSIPISAMNDVWAWCGAHFDFRRIGLNAGDELTYNIPENPDHPGTYQWEALDDAAAEQLIRGTIDSYVDNTLLEAAAAEDERRLDAYRVWWADHLPTPADLAL